LEKKKRGKGKKENYRQRNLKKYCSNVFLLPFFGQVNLARKHLKVAY